MPDFAWRAGALSWHRHRSTIPQLLAIRRLVDDRVDTMDGIEEPQIDSRQRLQTKRGYPGMEHTVDWMKRWI